MKKTRKITALSLVLVLLLTFAFPFVASARWTYFTSVSASLTMSGSTATFSGSCSGRSGATYKTVVYLINVATGTSIAGPFTSNTTSGPSMASVAGTATVGRGTYYTRAYYYAYENGKLVETDIGESNAKSYP